MTKRNWQVGLLAAAGTMALAAGTANAQDVQAATPDAPADEILVTGVRASVVRALANKEQDIRVTDSIQAEDLGKFPDTNLAESLQRVPGVSLERSASGNSRTITVRGLSSQFTQVQINGMGGATGGGGRSARFDSSLRNAGNDGRNFSFDVLPSELFTSAVIAKSPQARDVEGGIAANVELSTPGPFDMRDGNGSVAVEGTWTENAGVTPKVSGIYSHRFDDTFGILVGGVYSKNWNVTRQQGYNRFVKLSTVAADPSSLTQEQADALVPDGTQDVVRERKTDNYTLLGTAEWRPNSDTNLRFDAIYSHVDGIEEETQGRYRMTGGVVPTALDISNGVVQSGSLSSFTRSEVEFESNDVDDTLQQYTLSGSVGLGDFAGAHWSVEPFAGYNKRVQRRPFTQINAYGAAGTFDWNLADGVTGYTTSAPGFGSNPENFRVANVYSSINSGESEQYEGALDLQGEFDGPVLKAVRFGGRYTNRSTRVAEPFWGVINTGASPTLADLSTSTKQGILFTDIPGAADYLLGGQSQFDPSFDIALTRMTGLTIGTEAANALAASEVTEETLAGFFEADFKLGPIDLNAGVRLVSTDVSAKGAANVNGVVTPVDQPGSYTRALPALNAKLHLMQDLFLRGSYSRALSRPSLAALAPRETFNYTSLTGTRGNPSLKPFVVDQFDIGAEWYFHPEALLAATYFYKKFSSLIASETVFLPREVVGDDGTTTTEQVEFTQPYNAGSGSISGLEVTAQSSLFFLPGLLQNFGVQFNYTKLDSKTQIDTIDGNQAQPFPNLSPSSFNAGLYYDDGRFDARLNYAWRDGFLQDGLNPEENYPYQDAFGQLDLTMNYRVTERLNLQVQGSNLTNEKLTYSSSLAPLAVSEIELGRRIVVGARYSF